MDKKKVVIATPHIWDSPYRVGSHQYAKCFADDGWDVAFVSAQISPFHVLYYFLSSQREKVLLPQRWNSWVQGGKQMGGIWSYVPFGLIPIANVFPFNSGWSIRHSGKFLLPPLKRTLREKGFDKVHLIWLDSPAFGYLLDLVPHDKSVLRVADDMSGFQKLGDNLLKAEEKLAKKTDLAVVTARSLEKRLRESGAKQVLYLPNGVDFLHFTDATTDEPEDLKNIPHPRVIYVGVIESWFNDKWVYYSAVRRKDISFVLIGSYKKGTFPDLERLPNVYLLGKRDYGMIPSYLRNSQAGIIPFKKLPFIDSVNPIKLYEYMACGLPVVSTQWKSLEEIESPALLAEGQDDFAGKIDEALHAEKEMKEACVTFASENSWVNRFEFVKKYLL